MKYASLIAATAAAASLAGLPALADDVFVPAQSPEQYLAEDHLIGAKVSDADGKIIADVEDLIINSSNQVIGVIIGTGGVLGFNEKQVGVNLDALKFEEKNGKMVLSIPGVTAETLKSAPAFERTTPAKTLLERAQEKVHELSDKTKATTDDAIEQAKPAIKDATDKAKEAIDKAVEAAKPALEDAKKKAGEAIDAAKEAAQGAIDDAKKAADDASKPADATPPADTDSMAGPAPSGDAATPPADTTPPATDSMEGAAPPADDAPAATDSMEGAAPPADDAPAATDSMQGAAPPADDTPAATDSMQGAAPPADAPDATVPPAEAIPPKE